MPFIPHTEAEVRAMLATIGVESIEDLFDEIPADLRSSGLKQVPDGLSEMDISRLMHTRADQDSRTLCFAGAGAYEHHIPAGGITHIGFLLVDACRAIVHDGTLPV